MGGVCEAGGVDLVDGGFFPPGAGDLGEGFGGHGGSCWDSW